MFPIRPGKVACAGIVVIFMVLPNSIWKGPDAHVAPSAQPTVLKLKKMHRSDNPRVKYGKLPS